MLAMNEVSPKFADHGINPSSFGNVLRVTHHLAYQFEHLLKFNQLNNQAFLLRGVGHMFNNPLNSILLANKLIGNYFQDINDLFDELDVDPEQVPAGFREAGLCVLDSMPLVIKGISDSAGNLNQLVSLLSEFTAKRTDAGNGFVDLNQAISQCTSLTHHQICRHTKNFNLELESELPVVPGNAKQMTQLIFNLLINALLALYDRSCKVEISTSCDHAAGRIRICVKDTGSGMTPETFQQILVPFFSTWQEHGGIGLGLTVADLIIRNHGGELSIYSEPGEGTAVTVTLPLQYTSKNFRSESNNA